MWTPTKKLFTLFALFSLLFLSPISCQAATYQITEQELTTLEDNYKQQAIIITQLQNMLQTLKLDSNEANKQLLIAQEQLTVALNELNQSKAELQNLKQDLQNSNDSIMNANQYLQQYEKEVKQQTNKLKWQRNLAALVAGFFAFK